MYTSILMSTDGSDVAKKGVEHGLALAKALKAKATVVTVTEALWIDYGSGHASGWIPKEAEVESFDAACKERAGKVLDEARSMAERIGISADLLHVPNCAPSHCDHRNSKIQRLRPGRHGLAWASRTQEAIFGKSNIGGPRGRQHSGVGGALARHSQAVLRVVAQLTASFGRESQRRFGSRRWRLQTNIVPLSKAEGNDARSERGLKKGIGPKKSRPAGLGLVRAGSLRLHVGQP